MLWALGQVLVGITGSQVGPGGGPGAAVSHQLSLLGAVQSLCLVCALHPLFSSETLRCAPGDMGTLLWLLLLLPPGFPGSSRCCVLRGHEIPPVKHLGNPWILNQVKLRNCFKVPSKALRVTCTQVCAKASGDPEPPPCSSPEPQNCLVEKGMLERKEPDAGRAGMPTEQGLVLLASPRGGMGRGRGSLLPVATCFRCPGLRGACQLLSIEKWIILQSD